MDLHYRANLGNTERPPARNSADPGQAMEKKGQDKRRFRRSRDYGPRRINIRFEDAGGRSQSCEAMLWDFSEGGLGMDSPRAFEPGQILNLHADLQGPAYSVTLEAKARVAYCRRIDVKQFRVGVAFLEASYRRLKADAADA